MGQNVAAKNCPRTLLGCNIQSRLGQNCPRTNSVYSPKIVLGERVYINIHFTIAKSKQQHLNGYYINNAWIVHLHGEFSCENGGIGEGRGGTVSSRDVLTLLSYTTKVAKAD